MLIVFSRKSVIITNNQHQVDTEIQLPIWQSEVLTPLTGVSI